MSVTYVLLFYIFIIIIIFIVLINSLKIPNPPPPKITQVTYGNDGTVSCNAYCGGSNGLPQNNELSINWHGATCVSTNNPVISCDDVPITKIPNLKSINCTCTPTGTGWTKPSQMTYKSNGIMPCDDYCAGINGLPQNNELPLNWNGAVCVGTNNPSVSCEDVPVNKVTGLKSIGCLCEPTGAGWA